MDGGRRRLVVCDVTTFPVAVGRDVASRLRELRSSRLASLRKRAATVYARRLLEVVLAVASSAPQVGEIFCEASWLDLLIDLLPMTTQNTEVDILRVLESVVSVRAPSVAIVSSCATLFRQLCATAVESWWPRQTLSQERRAAVVTSMLYRVGGNVRGTDATIVSPVSVAEATAVTRSATIHATVHLMRRILLDAEWRATMFSCFETALADSRSMCEDWVACVTGKTCTVCGGSVLANENEVSSFLERHGASISAVLLISLVAGGMVDAIVPGVRVLIPSASHGFSVGTVISVSIAAGFAVVDVDGGVNNWAAAASAASGANSGGSASSVGGVKVSVDGVDAAGNEDVPGVDAHLPPPVPPGVAPSSARGDGTTKQSNDGRAQQHASRVSLPIARLVPLGDGLVSPVAVPFDPFLRVVLPLLSWNGPPAGGPGVPSGPECRCRAPGAAGRRFVEAVCLMSHLRAAIFRALGAMLQDARAAEVFLRAGTLPIILSAAVCSTTDAAAAAARAVKGTRECCHAAVELATRLGARVDCVELQSLQRRLWDQTSSPSVRAVRGLTAAQTLEAVCGDLHVCGGRAQAMSHFPTVRLAGGGVALGSGAWYYEVLLLSGGLVQIGWGDPRMQCDPARGHGAGDDPYSWAYDGQRQRIWFGGSAAYGMSWRAGDVVGCWADTRESVDAAAAKGVAFRFSLNGVDMDEAHVAFGVRSGLFPTASMEMQQVIDFNFGQRPFCYGPGCMPGGATARPVAAHTALARESKSQAEEQHESFGGPPSVELRLLPSPECMDRSALLEVLLAEGFPVSEGAVRCVRACT